MKVDIAMEKAEKERIAVVGGGIAGLTAAYLLNGQYDITLFEKENRVGGNAYTHQTKNGELMDIAVGAVAKAPGAHSFLKLCKLVNAETVSQVRNGYISLHDLDTSSGLYVTPLSLSGLLAQKFRLYGSLTMPRTLIAVRRLSKMLDQGELRALSMAEALNLIPGLKRLERFFIVGFLCTVTCLCYPDIMNGPAEYFVGKIKSFDLLNPLALMLGNYFPRKFTRSYVNALAAPFADKIVFNAEIQKILRNDKKVTVRMQNGAELLFDRIVFACNADQALALIENPTEDERKLLGAWKYKDVLMVVHRDDTYAPARPLCQPWTAIQSPRNGLPHFSISYCCWSLNPATSDKSEYFSTQHPNFPIKAELIDFQKTFRVPLVDFDSYPTIEQLPRLNGCMRSYFCGSHFGFCLHGHAVNSAVNVARLLGVDCRILER